MNKRALTVFLTGVAATLGLLPGAGAAPENKRFPFQGCFEIASQLHQVPMDLLLAVAATESNWNPDARSHANAHGIMQIQWPGTARHLGVDRISELYNPCLNIELGARYLRELLDRNDGNLDRALAAYNYGPSRLAGVAELPPGAARYVTTVNHHRSRIGRETAVRVADVQTQTAAGEIRFDHQSRAQRFAELLNRQIATARFAWNKAPDGRYAVTMEADSKGLSLADASRLQALGWPDLGAPP